MKTDGSRHRQGGHGDQTALSEALPLSAECQDGQRARLVGVNDEMKRKMLGGGGVGDGDNGIVDLKRVCHSRL